MSLYHQAEKLIFSLIDPTRKRLRGDLNRVKLILKELGDPHKKLRCIHITGTSGKGSTALATAAILTEHGLKTGLFTSPHLQKINERIKIDLKPISDIDLLNTAEIVYKASEKVAQKDGRMPLYFEFLTALALLHFAERKVDIAVIEVGVGGRKDSTNVIESEVACITNVGLEHTELLGDTVEKIAKDKAGIIKKNSTCITAATQSSVRKIIRGECENQNASLKIIDRKKIRNLKADLSKTKFTYPFLGKDAKFETKLLGDYQAVNIACALEICQHSQASKRLPALWRGLFAYVRQGNGSALNTGYLKGFNLSLSKAQKALKNLTHPGRLEIVQRKPLVILDGAHNSDKIKALISFLKELDLYDQDDLIDLHDRLDRLDPSSKRRIVFAMKKGKDYKKILHPLLRFADEIIITSFKLIGLSSIDPTVLKRQFDQLNKDNKSIKIIKDCKKAVKETIVNSGENDLILITGSLYLVGKARELWYPRERILKKTNC